MRYDAIIIGSGQAGNPLSNALAERGWTVALIERSHLGGTCVNTGCTPTKTMIASAQIAHYARNAVRWGIRAGQVSVDLPAIVSRKKAIVERFRAGIEKGVAKYPKVHLYRGAARFLSSRTVQIENEAIEGERIFINSGTRPAPPQLTGLDAVGYLTNESMMELQEVPEHLLVLGGGYIGLEFGQMFRRFGSDVTVIHHAEHLLPHEDPDVTTELQKALETEGIKFRLKSNPVQVERKGSQIRLTLASGNQTATVDGTHILAATGRRPNTDELSLEKTGVEIDSLGYIKVNERLETTVPGIWALGDVKGGPAFTHISYNDYQIVYANLVESKNVTIQNRYVPYSLFTDPQLGRVGMTEKEARAAGRRLKMGSYSMSHVARAIERGETAGFMKIIVDAMNDQILGAAILGAEGGELVQLLGVLMLAGAPYTILKGAVYIHPTLAEGFFGLMESVREVN
jgi:pyruvate/2-oxoglutarate dehydrogenase complex dihydrolipoamide dehydrogenase (E3) component